MAQAFEGVRIVDFTQVVAGPVATYQLGMLGAQVIKVEPVTGGDMARGLLDPTGFGHGEMAPAFIGVNHNKRSSPSISSVPRGVRPSSGSCAEPTCSSRTSSRG